MTQINRKALFKKSILGNKEVKSGNIGLLCQVVFGLVFFFYYFCNNSNDVRLVDEWEVKPHPARFYSLDESNITLKVPRVWNPTIRQKLGQNGTRLITPEEAQLVGTHVYVDGQQLPTIFVGIASYRDFRCVQTLENLFERAKYPQRVFVGIVDQIDSSGEDIPCQLDCTTMGISEEICKHQIRYYKLEASLSMGPVLARHLSQRLYKGEYFALQTDAHMEFIKDWDFHVVKQWQSTQNEMAILTTYVSNADEHHVDKTTGEAKTKLRPFMCDSIYDEDYYDDDRNNKGHMKHDQEPEVEPLIHGTPMLEPFWAAGFSFARGHFIIQVPYDYYLPMIFQGEEPSIGIRAFTYGYDFYAPEYSIVFHYYDGKSRNPPPSIHKEKNDKTNDKDKSNGEISLFWEQEDKIFHGQIALGAMNRLKGIIHTNPEIISYNTIEERVYGLGNVRATRKYFETFGIHPALHTVEKNLCAFVQSDMHELFSKHLRSNQMGIDYSQITFQFSGKDPKYQNEFVFDDEEEDENPADGENPE